MSQICTTSINIFNATFGGDSCGDIGINLNNSLSTSLSEVTTVEEFERIVYSELIDVKTRVITSRSPDLYFSFHPYLNSYVKLRERPHDLPASPSKYFSYRGLSYPWQLQSQPLLFHL